MPLVAADERLDATVAVKVLAENHSHDPDLRERFVREGQVLRRIDGAHVVTVHDHGIPIGTVNVILTAAPSWSWQTRVLEEGPSETKVAVEVTNTGNARGMPPLAEAGIPGLPATVNPIPGALGQPGTQVLFGNEGLDYGVQAGVRLAVGTWLDRFPRIGAEIGGFWLSCQSVDVIAQADALGNPPTFVPVFRPELGREGSFTLADPFLRALHADYILEFRSLSSQLASLDQWQLLQGVVSLAPLLVLPLAALLWSLAPDVSVAQDVCDVNGRWNSTTFGRMEVKVTGTSLAANYEKVEAFFERVTGKFEGTLKDDAGDGGEHRGWAWTTGLRVSW